MQPFYDLNWTGFVTSLNHGNLSEARRYLEKGCKEGNGALLYLAGRMESCNSSVNESIELFERAAKAGSVHSMLWMAWNYDRGQNGFPRSTERSAQLLAQARKENISIDELRFPELSFFKDLIKSTSDSAYSMSLDEDMNPDWVSMHYDIWSIDVLKEVLEIVHFEMSLGLTWGLQKLQYGEHEWDLQEKMKVCETERDWIRWCNEHLIACDHLRG